MVLLSVRLELGVGQMKQTTRCCQPGRRRRWTLYRAQPGGPRLRWRRWQSAMRPR